jgi:hypothetical protein
MKVPVTVNDLLDGHVGLDIECLDRIYLNGYVANLQCEGEVASFLTRHLGNPIASPAPVQADPSEGSRNRCACGVRGYCVDGAGVDGGHDARGPGSWSTRDIDGWTICAQ